MLHRYLNTQPTITFHKPIMPQLESAKKALRQSKKHQGRNKKYKNRIKKLYRQILDLSHDGKTKEATKLLPTYYKAIDKATKKNILHKNTAARKKSYRQKNASVFGIFAKNPVSAGLLASPPRIDLEVVISGVNSE